MSSTFGPLTGTDSYFVVLNSDVNSAWKSASDTASTYAQQGTSERIGKFFIYNTFYVKTFLTHAAHDQAIDALSIPRALRTYTDLLSVCDETKDPGWIDLTYAQTKTNGRIRFPFYPNAGHTVSMLAPDDYGTSTSPGQLLSDVMQWY
jgi:hypothetical protein